MTLTPAQSEYIAMQRQITRQIKAEKDNLLPAESPAHKRYYTEYRREFQHDWLAVSSHEDLLRQIHGSDIIYVGDFHTLKFAQQTFLYLAKHARKEKLPIALALEMFQINHRVAINKYLSESAEMTESDLLAEIDYPNTWGFPWENYKRIINFAKSEKIPIMPVNCHNPQYHSRSPRKKDECIARRIVSAVEEYPERKIFVLVGDLHLASQHLPRAVAKELKKCGMEKKSLTVFQNSETYYWRLAEEGLDHKVEVLKIHENPLRYCIMTTAPWIKWQTFLGWMEYGEDVLCTAYTGGVSDETAEDAPTWFDMFNDAVNKIALFFDIKRRSDESDTRCTIYTMEDKHSLSRLTELGVKPEVVKKILENGIMAYFHGKFVLYLARYDINYTSEGAGEFLYDECSAAADKTDIKEDHAFLIRIISKALGGLSSKVLNPKRKISSAEDHRLLIIKEGDRRLRGARRERRETAKFIVALADGFKKKEEISLKFFARKDDAMSWKISAGFGRALGRSLYEKTLDGALGKPAIREWFRKFPRNAKQAQSMIKEMLTYA